MPTESEQDLHLPTEPTDRQLPEYPPKRDSCQSDSGSKCSADIRPPKLTPTTASTLEPRQTTGSVSGSSTRFSGERRGENRWYDIRKEEQLDGVKIRGRSPGPKTIQTNRKQANSIPRKSDREIKRSKAEATYLKLKLKQMKTKLEEANSSCRHHKDEEKELRGDLSKLGKDYGESQKKLKDLQDRLNETQETINIQKGEIDKFTEAISLSGNRFNTTTRDDDYFEEKFTKLAGDIHQWVMRNFRGTSDAKLQNLPKPVQESVKSVILSDETIGEPQIRLKEIEAVIVDQLVHGVFWRFPLGMPKLRDGLWFVNKSLGSTDLERRRWYAQTVDMIISDEHYKDCFRKVLNEITKYLKYSLDIRITVHREDCDKALFAIVEQAAKLSEEIYRQIADFQICAINPGVPYNPEHMEDMDGMLNDEMREKPGESEGIAVHKVLFPVVARYGFDEAGKMVDHPVIVRKAKVVVIRLEGKKEDIILNGEVLS